MSKLNIGIIGAGSVAEAHLKAYQANEGANLYAVADLNEARARATADKYGMDKFFADYRELLADPKIDAVSICTWNNLHAEMSIAALRAGKHVLLEKPLSRTVEEAERIRDAVRESGKILQVGFVRRYDENAQIMRQFIEKGELGEIYYAKASWLRRLGNPGGWFADVERAGGGPLIDIGVHMIDLCWYLMGRPKPVAVSGNVYNKLGNRANVEHLSFYKTADYNAAINTVEDMANALIRFENGASLMVDVSFTIHAKQDEFYVKLFGDKGGAEVEPSMVMVSEKHNTILNIFPQTDSTTFHSASGFKREIAHFIDCCRDGTTPISPVDDGVEMMKILRGVYESAEKGTEIRL